MHKRVEVASVDHEAAADVAGEDVVLGEKQGTLKDMEDMRRMGKEQLFKVRMAVPSWIV